MSWLFWLLAQIPTTPGEAVKGLQDYGILYAAVVVVAALAIALLRVYSGSNVKDVKIAERDAQIAALHERYGTQIAQMKDVYGDRYATQERSYGEKFAALEKVYGERVATLEKVSGEKIAALERSNGQDVRALLKEQLAALDETNDVLKKFVTAMEKPVVKG